MRGWDLRRLRHERGLTLRAVARAAGTSESNVSAYERGTKRPGRRTEERLVAVIDAGVASPIHAHDLLTVPALAAAIRTGLRDRWPTGDLLRLVRQMRSDARYLRTRADHRAFHAEPSTTGDPRWEAMLAGVVEDLLLTEGRTTPAWVAIRGRPLDEFWFVSDVAALDAYAFAHSPFSLQVRGVLVDPGDLEAV